MRSALGGLSALVVNAPGATDVWGGFDAVVNSVFRPVSGLVDTSGSMIELSGARRRIDIVRDVLENVLREAPARVFAFDNYTRELDGPSALPEPSGGTVLDRALEQIAAVRPEPLIVISDGEPFNAEAALAAARTLSTHITTIFVGDERNHAAIAFLRALAWCSSDGLGQAVVSDLRKPHQLTATLHSALLGTAR